MKEKMSATESKHQACPIIIIYKSLNRCDWASATQEQVAQFAEIYKLAGHYIHVHILQLTFNSFVWCILICFSLKKKTFTWSPTAVYKDSRLYSLHRIVKYRFMNMYWPYPGLFFLMLVLQMWNHLYEMTFPVSKNILSHHLKGLCHTISIFSKS